MELTLVWATAIAFALSFGHIHATSLVAKAPTGVFYDYCDGYYYDSEQESSQYYDDPQETFANCASGCAADTNCATFEVDIDRTEADEYSICYYFNAHPSPADLSYYLTPSEELGVYYKRTDPDTPAVGGLPAGCDLVICIEGVCNPVIVPSGSFKRARRAAEATQERLAAANLCAPNEDACYFSSSDGNYECTDYSHDIESCGGCVHMGEGVNCLAIDGVSGVGCVDGTCVASSCLFGWKLVDDLCVEE